jgi:hypothetical protein
VLINFHAVQIVQLQYKLDDSVMTQRTLHIRVGESDVKMFMDRVTQRLKQKAEVPGFRRGKAPLPVVRKHYMARVKALAFEDLRYAAVDQAVSKLEEKDRPFLPPEVVNRDKVKIEYGEALEFQVSYLIEPSGIAKRPDKPHLKFDPLADLHNRNAPGLPRGIPSAPRVPAAPARPEIPATPRVPNVPRPAKPTDSKVAMPEVIGRQSE